MSRMDSRFRGNDEAGGTNNPGFRPRIGVRDMLAPE